MVFSWWKAKITPSHFRALFEARRTPNIVPRRALIFGGERLSGDLIKTIHSLRPSCRLFNHYGPTECTVGAVMMEIDPDQLETDESVPLGKPLANTQIYVLDGSFRPVPIGMIGEVHIAGAGVGIGYHNRPEETAARFVKSPFHPDPAARMYKTGDLCRWLPSGAVEFLGRNDIQVKIRGFRIELGEIEAELSRHLEVKECAVAVADEGGTKRLLGYYTSGADIDTADLRKHLSHTLPEHMVPAIFIRLPKIPITANGKLDRHALPSLTACSPRQSLSPQWTSDLFAVI